MAERKVLFQVNGISQELGSGDTLEHLFVLIEKTGDENKSTNATLGNDSALFFTMAANTKYSIKICIYGDAPATPGFKWALIGPASPTLVRVERQTRAPAATTKTVAADTAYTASTAIVGNATSNFFLEIDLIVQNGVNGGTFAFQWAQSTSNGTASTVRAGSYLKYTVI
jgi:hypothetical protein